MSYVLGIPLLFVILIYLPLFLLEYLISRLALKLSVLASLGLALLVCFLGLCLIILPNIPHSTLGLTNRTGHFGLGRINHLLVVLLFLVFGIPFLIKIIRKWRGIGLSEAERKPGWDGFKAWFSAGNIVWGLLLVICGYIIVAGFWNAVFIVLILLGIYPALNTLKSTGSKEGKPREGESREKIASEETDKILKMLEQGKITAEEASDLLNALAQTHSIHHSSPVALSLSRRLILIGAAVVLLGSFFPWLKVDLGKVPMPQMSEMSMVSIQNAYDIKHGLGWLVVLFALGIAALPYLNLRMDRQTLQTISFLALGLGSAFLLNVFFSSFRFVSIGLLVVIGGYCLEIAGLIQEKKTPWIV